MSAKGLQPSPKNVRAIQAVPVPKDVTQLKSFLGMVTYYLKFLPNLSNTLTPLYSLLQKEAKWKWTKEQGKAFTQVKEQLTSPVILTTFDPEKELLLQCDASSYGLGAVLSHRDMNGMERPIAYCSRTLAPAEKCYSQLDKEALALVFTVNKFHTYLYGRKFTLISDHKPLQHIMGEKKGVPQMASARLQRWSLLLGAYNYTIQFKPGQENQVADALSRLPLPDCPSNIPTPGETIFLVESLSSTPINTKQVAKWTSQDPILSRVRHLIERGWTDINETELTPYKQRQNELSVAGGCILWGSRVVIPVAGRDQALNMLHEGHLGMSRMKSKARSFMWWPKLDLDIERLVKNCSQCQLTRHSPAPAPCQSWDYPPEPWRRLHIDYAGPFYGKMFLLVIDAHSKWLEVEIVNSANTITTLEKLRRIFATHGLPSTIVTDNGSVFTSEEFQTFVLRNGIVHSRTTPYHPASNGQVERVVQMFKEGIKRSGSGSLETKLSRFLFHYRTTPHTTTGATPAELLMGRHLRTHLDVMHPDLTMGVESKQEKQRVDRNKGTKDRTVNVEDTVFVQDLPARSSWIPGVVTGKCGPLSYTVALSNGCVVRRHIDNIRLRETLSVERQDNNENEDWPDSPNSPNDNAPEDILEAEKTKLPARRSTRERRQPDRFAPYINQLVTGRTT